MSKKKSKVRVIAILMFSVLLIGFASVFPTEFSKAHADSEDIWFGKE